MKGASRDWLAACPAVRRISTLALDAWQLQLADFPNVFARAIASAVLADTTGKFRTPLSRSRQAHTAWVLGEWDVPYRLRIVDGTVLLEGSIAHGTGLSQWVGGAVIHLSGRLPQTAIGAIAGRHLAEVVDAPLFRDRRYIVESATEDRYGLSIVFDVESVPAFPEYAFPSTR